jgi:sulfite reductase (ferredoxin)
MTTAAAPALSLEEEVELFGREIERFRRSEVSEAEFRTFRVPRGVYEQRESGTYMLRVRFPAGVVLPEHMRALAHASQEFGNGVLHVTTRQDIQVHRVLLDNIQPALSVLAAAGLSTKGGGGNTVRNITGCSDAGVCPYEQFDVAPYVSAVTERLLPDPLSYQLPRKYKLAFSGCPRDCAGATVNDLGFIAKTREGQRGFAVYVAGGMGASSRVGDLLEEFIPAEQAHLTAEAVKRVFDQHGNRRNRNRARLRFLVQDIGLPRLRELYAAELSKLRQSAPASLRPEPSRTPSALPANGGSPSPGFIAWVQQQTSPQRQSGYCLVRIPLDLGDIRADVLRQLADVVQQRGERSARTTQRQDMLLRWIHQSELAALHVDLAALGLVAGSTVHEGIVACTGAATCRLGICLSGGLARAVNEALKGASLGLDGESGLKINISGCPNACGRHPIADIGLYGAARRVHGRLAPHYVLQLGGKVAEGETRLAQGEDAYPARNIPALIVDLLGRFRHSGHWPDFAAFVETHGAGLSEALAKYRDVPPPAEDRDYYVDWGAADLFSLAGRGPGECGAGVFDLIEVDLANARDALQRASLVEATLYAARALLVTRGQQSHDDSETLDLFTQHFLDEQLVDASFNDLVTAVRARVAATGHDALPLAADSVSRFVAAIDELYRGMDSSLRFKPAAVVAAPPASLPTAALERSQPDRQADFRGVTCPLNYVRTTMVLTQMKSGQVLSVLLDEPGSRNVPSSVEKDGHAVLAVEEQQGHWKLTIRKA